MKEESTSIDNYRPLAKALRYAEPIQNLMLLRPRLQVIRLLKEYGRKSVLDVCCGAGKLMQMLLKRGFEVHGVDSSETMLERARAKKLPNLHKQDATEFTFERAFDACVICLALHEMEQDVRLAVWERMKAAVKPEGYICIFDYDPPDSAGLLSRFGKKFIDMDEHSFVDHHPEHYENFKDFMACGGVRGWVREHGGNVVAEKSIWAGNGHVALVRP